MPPPRRRRDLFASWKPLGIGEQRPNNYTEIFRAAWGARRHPSYAWRILTRGVCDGCALGTTGIRDWTLDGVHLCNVRLRLLPSTRSARSTPRVLDDAEALRGRPGAELRALGRIPRPLMRRKGEPGFRRVLGRGARPHAARISDAGADRVAAFLTSRGMPNESYYAAQKAMRAIGTNSIDNAARVCHSPSTYGLKEALGVGARPAPTPTGSAPTSSCSSAPTRPTTSRWR